MTEQSPWPIAVQSTAAEIARNGASPNIDEATIALRSVFHDTRRTIETAVIPESAQPSDYYPGLIVCDDKGYTKAMLAAELGNLEFILDGTLGRLVALRARIHDITMSNPT